MKTKLLRKAKRKLKMYKRNRFYYVDIGNFVSEFDNITSAQRYYRAWVLINANRIFGFKPKKQLI